MKSSYNRCSGFLLVILSTLFITFKVYADDSMATVEYYDFIPNDLCVVEYDLTDIRCVVEEKTEREDVSSTKDTTSKEKKSDNELKSSDLIAIIAIVVSAVLSALTLYLTFLTNARNHKNSVHDEFWMRQILIPKFITPFMLFIDESVQKYIENEHNLTLYYVKYARVKLNQLQDSIIVIEAVSPSLGDKLSNIIESFHDKAGDAEGFSINNIDDFKVKLLMEASRDVILAIKAEQLRKKKGIIARMILWFKGVFSTNGPQS